MIVPPVACNVSLMFRENNKTVHSRSFSVCNSTVGVCDTCKCTSKRDSPSKRYSLSAEREGGSEREMIFERERERESVDDTAPVAPAADESGGLVLRPRFLLRWKFFILSLSLILFFLSL